jgi:sorbitol-specific phosphotransferase system component IIBC
MRQGDDCSVAARITHASSRSDSCWSRVVGVSDRKFRSHKDGFTTLLRELVGSFGESLILSFVIGDDPVDSVIRKVAPFTHQTSLIGLYANSQINHGVHVRM